MNLEKLFLCVRVLGLRGGYLEVLYYIDSFCSDNV
jgi:hypothetical protein